ncbi:MAG TPA: GNAT family N-acetyltransferase [Candidatus Borkfalkia excrementavium]|uniref:GNAT family N-acetyltransferase n=1 Tax=Candidatus Borkfalkia excrementavium TaxID=2838505 RepID=A0A9D2CFA7_9FIRM|nr:GNAT family N-acetyltransferase [Candidatus Borkfalkia excrementavium]
MQFKKLEREDIPALIPYFQKQKTHISNYSVSFLFMWFRHQNAWFAVAEDCLIVREQFITMPYFHFPVSRTGDEESELRALEALEDYCRKNRERLHFTNVPKSRLALLVERYGSDVHVSNPRRWRDYLYLAEDFKTYPGGRYSGQRNHVNKFLKNYPDYQFCDYKREDLEEIYRFLKEYSAVQLAKDTFSAQEELRAVEEIMPHIEELGMVSAYVRVGGKIVSLSVGEICGDMMIVVIEKALRGYQGAYPAIAQFFARRFCGEGIRYINREDDAGDLGLRKSKLQYLPAEIVDKYNLAIKRPIDTVSQFPRIKTERLTLKKIPEKDAARFARLAKDDDLNRWWGYDWHDDAPEDVSDAWFLEDVYADFKKKDEIRLGVYFGGELIGEAVLHNFGYRAEAEVGVRILREYQGRGFAREAVEGLFEYGFAKLSLEKIEAKCFKENAPSERMLRAAGMRPCGEDERYFYFYKTAAM